MSLPEDRRELRLDFLRGVALLVVLIDHIEMQTSVELVQLWTPISTGFSDGADAFVFLSGLVFGLIYKKRLARDGLFRCQKKVLRRSLSIYFMYLVTAWVAIGIGLCFGDMAPLLVKRLSLEEGVGRCIVWSLPMCYQPYGLPILSFYAVILPFLPLLLLMHLRYRAVAWVLPFGLYLGAQTLDGLQLPRFPWGQEWQFNPFAWQLLLYLGLVLGAGHFSVPSKSWVRGVLLILSITVLVFGLAIRKEWFVEIPGIGLFHETVDRYTWNWSGKTRLEPLRIVHLLCLAYVLSRILPGSDSRFWRGTVAAPLVKCGQHSLAVYAFGVILMFLSIPVFIAIGETPATVLLIELDACLLSVLFAYFLAGRRHSSNRTLIKQKASESRSAGQCPQIPGVSSRE